MTFDTAVEFVLAHEGGYSDDPADTGGTTKFGISRRFYPDIDIAKLTREDAILILKRDYWDKCHCDELPEGLKLLVFDAAVNQGQGQAGRMLQAVLKVTQDGAIGAVTIRAAMNQPGIEKDYLARRMYQYSLVPQVLRFGYGWFRRLADAAEVTFKNDLTQE